MEVPSPRRHGEGAAVEVGDKVTEGTLISAGRGRRLAAAPRQPQPAAAPAQARTGSSQRRLRRTPARRRVARRRRACTGDEADLHAEVLVLGAGPGGYTAAFRAADLGKKVVLVER